MYTYRTINPTTKLLAAEPKLDIIVNWHYQKPYSYGIIVLAVPITCDAISEINVNIYSIISRTS